MPRKRKSDKREQIEGLPPPRKPGRPTLLTPKLQKVVVDATRAGAFSWVAAATAGISPTTHARWIGDGKVEFDRFEVDGTPLGPQGEYYVAVTRARALARFGAERMVMKTAPLAWLTKGPGRDKASEPGWSDSNKVELSGPDGGPIPTSDGPTHDLSKLSLPDLILYENLLTKCAATPQPT